MFQLVVKGNLVVEISERLVQREHFGLDTVRVRLQHAFALGHAGGFLAYVA